jgi:hypothetical protein
MEKKKEKKAADLVGICGIYCGTCPKYLAQRDRDTVYLEETARQTGLRPEEIRCDGCLSADVFPSCRDCRHGFRRCAAEHRVTWCFQCPEFPCPRLKNFLPIHVVDGVSHHAGLVEELKYLRARGIEEWLEKQDRSGRCPQCGKVLYWYARECPACRSPIARPSAEKGKKQPEE